MLDVKNIASASRQGKTIQRAYWESLSDNLDPGEIAFMSNDAFLASRLKIKNKRGRIVPFIMNKAQYDFEQNRTGRDLIVKPRQIGFSTKMLADTYHALLIKDRLNAVIIGDTAENTTTLVEIFNRFHGEMPDKERPFRQGRYPHGIKFPMKDSLVYLGTAGSRRWGHGKTVLRLHASEVAFWPDAKSTMDALLESVPTDPDMSYTSVVMESTPNGAAGYFYEEVQKALKGDSGYKVHFYTWWWEDSYRLPLAKGEKIKLTKEERRLVKRVYREEHLKLTPEQIKWRRAKISERQDEFFQEYPEDIATCFLLSGRPRFNVSKIKERLDTQMREPEFVAYPVMNRGNEYFQLRIYEKPTPGRRYVMGADVAEGLIVTSSGDPDFCAAVIRDKVSNRQVATIHGRFEPVEFAYILQQIGRFYNNALLGVERNNHGHAVLGFLIHGSGNGAITPYTNLYVHYEDGRPGWPTTTKTRPAMIGDLAAEYAHPDNYIVRDKQIMSEALTFVINPRGKAEASPGAFDDLIFADAIAGQMRTALREETEVEYNPVQIGDF